MSTTTTELARREERAQGGIIQFAEEMQAIRDGNLYPGAGTNAGDPWGTYCKQRWSLSKGRMNDVIRAAPVLKRLSGRDSRPNTTVEKATSVATLPVAVQDAILYEQDGQIHEHDVKAKAKAARAAVVWDEVKTREATEDEVAEMVTAAAAVVVNKPKKKKAKRTDSKFLVELVAACSHIKAAADIATATALTDTENDFGWNGAEKVDYHLARIREVLSRPDNVRDVDAEFSELLGGEVA